MTFNFVGNTNEFVSKEMRVCSAAQLISHADSDEEALADRPRAGGW